MQQWTDPDAKSWIFSRQSPWIILTTMTDDLTLSYLAGAIDSDGCIAIKRSTYSMRVRGDAGAPIFSERIMLKQVTLDIPALLKETFGGSLRIEGASANRGRPLYAWQTTDLQAANCLRVLLPFLRIKRKQAMNCLALRTIKEESKIARVARGRGHAGSAPRSDALTDAMEARYADAKMLNTVGA